MTDNHTTLPLSPEQRRQLWYLLGFALLLLGIGIGLRDPWPSDEPRFALVAHWMVERGQWLFPHRGHELYPDKPPLFMWLQAVFYLVTRTWRLAFMLPSLLSGLLCVGLVYDLGRRLWDHRSGLLASLLMLVTVQFSWQFRHAQIDPLVVAWITLANYGLLRHMLLGPAWRWYFLGCFAAGLGVITKGVGVLALFMLLPYAFARLRHWPELPHARGALRWLAGFGFFLLAIALWLGPMLWRAHALGDAAHAAYVQNILFGQTVHRYADFAGHQRPWWYFGQVIALNWLPLSLLLPWAVPAWWRRLRAHDARVLLPLAWVVLVVLFFSLSSGKRGVYILPALPMAALTLAPLLAELHQRLGVRVAVLLLTLVLSLTLTGAGITGLVSHADWAARIEASISPAIWYLPLATGVVGLVAVAWTRIKRAPLGWVLFVSFLWASLGLYGYPLLNGDRSAAEIMQEAREKVGPDVTLGLVAWKEQNLLQARGPVTEFGFLKPWQEQYTEAVAWLKADPASRRLFIREAAMGECVRRDEAIQLDRANRRDWWLVPARAIIPNCVPAKVPGH